MAEYKISVIVPIYNAERYLHTCVDSILKQTYNNIELILVDDGSVDKSGILCDDYQKQDNRVVVIHKNNGGVSAARNTGIDAATGKFMVFSDSDDHMPEEALRILIERYEECQADLICGSYFIETKRKNRPVTFGERVYDKEAMGAELYKLITATDSPWGKLFRTDIIKNHAIRFREGIPSGEDTLFDLEYLYYCDRVKVVSDYVYFYNRAVEGSAVTKFYPDFDYYQGEIFEAGKRLVESNIKDANTKDNSIAALAGMICSRAIRHYAERDVDKVHRKVKIEEIQRRFAPYCDESAYDIFDEQEKQCLKNKRTEEFIRLRRKKNRKHRIKLVIKRVIRG